MGLQTSKLVYIQGSSNFNVGLHTRVFKAHCWFTQKGLQSLMYIYIQGSSNLKLVNKQGTSNFNVGLQFIQGTSKFKVGCQISIFIYTS